MRFTVVFNQGFSNEYSYHSNDYMDCLRIMKYHEYDYSTVHIYSFNKLFEEYELEG